MSYIARYADVWNRHRKSEIHDIHEIDSGMKLYYLWVKGYSTWGERERERHTHTHNPSMLTAFTSSLNHVRSPPQTTGLASAGHESQPFSSEARTQLTAFSQIQKSSAHVSGAWRHSHPLVSISYLGFFILTSLNDTSPPRSSLLLHQYSAYLARLTWMAWEMGDKRPYSLSFQWFLAIFILSSSLVQHKIKSFFPLV